LITYGFEEDLEGSNYGIKEVESPHLHEAPEENYENLSIADGSFLKITVSWGCLDLRKKQNNNMAIMKTIRLLVPFTGFMDFIGMMR
jgi:hypothetical protein